MLEIHLYGILKKKIDPKASFSEDTVIQRPYRENERLSQLLDRLNIRLDECGEMFCNGSIASVTTVIPKGARIGLFSTGMHLLCGGQHLKGHGYKTNNLFQKNNYY